MPFNSLGDVPSERNPLEAKVYETFVMVQVQTVLLAKLIEVVNEMKRQELVNYHAIEKLFSPPLDSQLSERLQQQCYPQYLSPMVHQIAP